jgi:hypothetical protein
MKHYTTKRTHPVFATRGITEGWLIVNPERWDVRPNHRGGFVPVTPPGYRPVVTPDGPVGHLWPTREKAEECARALTQKYPGRSYLLFQAVAIVEPSAPPVTVTEL